MLELIDRSGGQVDGVKLSVLDEAREVSLRRRLPAGVRLYTGDDFNYASLIRGDADGSHSDALLGAFAAITAPAAAALAALDRGDLAGYDAAMEPTVPLSRLIFEPPTYRYKAGVAFLAWLNGLQPQFVMLGGLERAAPGRAPDPAVRAGRGGRGADRAGASGRRMGEMLARSARSAGVTGGIGLDRLSLNQATVKHLGLKEAVALCVRHDIPAIGLWRDRSRRPGWPRRRPRSARPGCGSPACAGAVSSRWPILTGAGRRRRTTWPRSRRRPSWAPARWCWSAAGCRPGSGTSAWPGG